MVKNADFAIDFKRTLKVTQKMSEKSVELTEIQYNLNQSLKEILPIRYPGLR